MKKKKKQNTIISWKHANSFIYMMIALKAQYLHFDKMQGELKYGKMLPFHL